MLLATNIQSAYKLESREREITCLSHIFRIVRSEGEKIETFLGPLGPVQLNPQLWGKRKKVFSVVFIIISSSYLYEVILILFCG